MLDMLDPTGITELSRTMALTLRQVALVAALYGQDPTSPDVRALLMWCLVPADQANAESGEATSVDNRGGTGAIVQRAAMHAVAKKLSRKMQREIAMRMGGGRMVRTGLKLGTKVLGRFFEAESSHESSRVEAAERARQYFNPNQIGADQRPFVLRLLPGRDVLSDKAKTNALDMCGGKAALTTKRNWAPSLRVTRGNARKVALCLLLGQIAPSIHVLVHSLVALRNSVAKQAHEVAFKMSGGHSNVSTEIRELVSFLILPALALLIAYL